MHISIGAALGEAAKKLEGALNTGGLIAVGVLVVAVVVVVLVRRSRKARVAVVDDHKLPVGQSETCLTVPGGPVRPL
ncbi:hypothetical protein GCM10029964_022370 [Kibdelosporangium lantanae]